MYHASLRGTRNASVAGWTPAIFAPTLTPKRTAIEPMPVGYKGHSRITSFVIGTTAQKVNAYSRASVLIVKDTAPREARIAV
jgi:hypothetical protein